MTEPNRRVCTSKPCLALAAAVLCLSAMGVQPGAAGAQSEPRDVSGMRPPRWQLDAELSGAWARFTGRYIYQRACTDCHTWGPGHLSRTEWSRYMSGFPANHEPDVSKDYEDLTAQFTPGKYVPEHEQLVDALSAFLLESAPEQASSSSEEWQGLPAIGAPAPPFVIIDIDGREHSLESYRGSQPLVLVFSRAHW